jgi:hypothetical protein
MFRTLHTVFKDCNDFHRIHDAARHEREEPADEYPDHGFAAVADVMSPGMHDRERKQQKRATAT